MEFSGCDIHTQPRLKVVYVKSHGPGPVIGADHVERIHPVSTQPEPYVPYFPFKCLVSRINIAPL